MKKWFIHILLLAGLFGMLTTSCSQDEEIANIPSAGTPSEKVTIRFTLDLGEQGGMSSRATWEGYDEDDTSNSNGDENAINNIQVFMFSTDGAYIGGLKDMEYEQQVNSNIYNIKGEVDVVKTAIGANEVLNCKIMVVANADATSVESGKVTDFNNEATFNHNVSYIPMWGIGTYSINLIQQLQVDLDEPIYMLRSMAKIEVKLSDDVYNNGYRITSATLNNYNTQGYVVPAFVIPETDESTTATTQTVNLSNLDVTTDLSTAGVYRPLANKSTNKALSNIDNKKTYVIYVPEMAKGKGTDAEPYNKVSLELGRVATAPDGTETITNITGSVMSGNPHIVLKDYAQGGSHFDITRNWYYRYTINTISDGMNITLAVAPWQVNEDVLDYTQHTASISVTSETGVTLGWVEDTYIEDDDNNTIITLNGANTAIFKVKINTPTNAEWKAVLEDPNDIFEFNTNTSDGFSGSPQGEKNIYGFNDVVGGVVTIGVKSKDASVVGTYSAVLRMYVNVGTKWVQVDLVDANIANKISVYTIKHVKAQV